MREAVRLTKEPVVRLSDGQFVLAATYRGDREKTRTGSMAWQILSAHNHSRSMEHLELSFDTLLSPDDNYTSVMQELAAVGFPALKLP